MLCEQKPLTLKDWAEVLTERGIVSQGKDPYLTVSTY